MFRASSAHLQEDRVVYMQHMVLSLSTRVLTQAVYRQATTNSIHDARSEKHQVCIFDYILITNLIQ